MRTIEIILQIAGAVALLLFGLSQIRAGIESAFGMHLKMILGVSTKTRWRAFIAGLITTLGLQSSTATALLTATYVQRKLINAVMAQAVLLGANVGTALTAFVVSLGLEALAPIIIFIGYLGRRHQGQRWAGVGTALIGVGLMLLALQLLDSATSPMRHSEVLAAFLAMLDSLPLLALLMAAVIAFLCSSSLAAVLLIMAVPMPTTLTIAMVLGANLGGAVPAVVATLSEGKAAQRLTVGNLIVRGIGCLIAFPCISLIASGLAHLPAWNSGLAVEFHVLLNIALAIIILPAIKWIHRLVLRLIGDKADEQNGVNNWLDEDLLTNPPLAIAGACREVLAIGDIAEKMLEQLRTAFVKHDRTLLKEISDLEEQIDARQHNVKDYLSRLANTAEDSERRRIINILDYAINLEHIGDIVEKNLLPEVRQRAGLSLYFSDEGFQELDRMFLMTQENLRLAQTVFLTEDKNLAKQLIEQKVAVRNFERQSSHHHLQRLSMGDAESRDTSSLHLDILRDLKRINAHAVSVAYPILDEEGMLVESRLRSEKKKKKKTGS